MMRYLTKRTLQSVLTIFVILTLVFVGGRQIGDPATLILGAEASEADRVALRGALGLEDPMLEQYQRFMTGAITGDFGDTFRYGRRSNRSDGSGSAEFYEGGDNPSLPLVLERLPATFLLAGVALSVAFVLALALGTLAALRPRSLIDRMVNVVSLAGVSIVDFWLGLMLILGFAVNLGWLPTSGSGGWRYVLLPAATLAVRPIGRLAQMVRSSMMDELSKPYVEAARAKGASETRVVYVHALKNAAIPTVTMMGDESANILTGVIIIEVVFAWPGIGQLLIDALSLRDLPLIEASIFVLALIVITINWIVDLTYTRLDPQVKLSV